MQRVTFCPRSVCHRVLDLFFDTYGRDPREDGAPSHPLPCARQHLQHSHDEHSQSKKSPLFFHQMPPTKAEGLTAIEAWMLACILFVFGALIE